MLTDTLRRLTYYPLLIANVLTLSRENLSITGSVDNRRCDAPVDCETLHSKLPALTHPGFGRTTTTRLNSVAKPRRLASSLPNVKAVVYVSECGDGLPLGRPWAEVRWYSW